MTEGTFRRAIVRPPAPTLAKGLTTVDLGAPDLARARKQHTAYCEALERCGLTITVLPEDAAHPDSTFVEDTAILSPGQAILTRPGAPSRRGEVGAIESSLTRLDRRLRWITPPGTLDGGDVCEAGGRFLIGISQRTNAEGARQLTSFLAEEDFPTSTIDIRDVPGILHLKSGIASIGHGRVVAIEALREHPELRAYEIVTVENQEAYAANCVLVNGTLIMPAGYPRLEATFVRLGYEIEALSMSEFEKLDGGLSCLSLRF